MLDRRSRGARGRSGTASPALQWLAVGFLLFLAGAAWLERLPRLVFGIYLAVSIVTFGTYALDKMAAQRGAQRTSERALHLLSLFGGWPGALLAQTRLRHKTQKQPFRAIFWMTVVLNGTALAWLLTPQGVQAWQRLVAALVPSG